MAKGVKKNYTITLTNTVVDSARKKLKALAKENKSKAREFTLSNYINHLLDSNNN